MDLLQWDEQTRQICIDGKTMRGVKKLSPDTESHIVSAYDPHLQLVLSMDAVPVKRNELDAIRRLLDELDVTDALITIDAIGCQHDVAAQVLEAGGDYVLQVKGNQPTLLQELEDSFPNISKGYTVNKEDGWSKRAGEAAINMALMAKIDLFILQRLKAKLGKSIPRVQMFLAKINPLQLFELGL